MTGIGLEVQEAGETTTVGFSTHKVLGAEMLETCRNALLETIDRYQPRVLRLDLTGVDLITGDLLGFLISLRNRGLTIVIYNPSDDVRLVMQVTKLDTLIELVGREKCTH